MALWRGSAIASPISAMGAGIHGVDYPFAKDQVRFHSHLWVCRLTKVVHFLPTHDSATAEDIAKLFRDRIFCLHGLPKGAISDRNSKFTCAFWQELHRLLGVKLHLSTANHPQTMGKLSE